MAFSLGQWVNRSLTIAQAALAENMAVSLAIDDTAEALCHNVMFEVVEEFAGDPLLQPYVRETITVALTNGSATLPSRVLIGFMADAAVADPADATMAKSMRWVKDWDEFIRPLDSTLGYFTVVGQTFFMTRPGSAYTPGAGMTGNISLTTPAAYDMPANETATITLPLRVELALVDRLAYKLIPRAKERNERSVPQAA